MSYSEVSQNVSGSGNIFSGSGNIQVGFSAADVAMLLRAAVPPPTFADLFEVVRDPAQVPAAIFRTSGRGLSPHEIPHASGREGVADIQVALYDALLGSGGALLVEGRAGVGKTREVSQLAVQLCERGWVICLARGEGDSRMNAPAGFPDGLQGSRLLFVLDDLHIRTVAGTGDQRPYVERLGAFLEFFDRAMSPGEFYAIATSRAEPHHWKKLGYDPAHQLWRRFRLYEMPEFSSEALQQLLIKAARQAGIDVDEELAAQLVNNSDKTPRTLISNIRRAQHGRSLDAASWLPTQGESWGVRFREACGRWTAADEVFEALHLVREAGLPTRIAYVAALGSHLADSDAMPAAEGLVDMGLLGLRRGVLDAFGDEQLRDSLRTVGRVGLPSLDGHWNTLRRITRSSVEHNPEWTGDIVRLASRLSSIGLWSDAESDFSFAIERGQAEPLVYSERGFARFFQHNHAGAEEDFTVAIERGANDARNYFGRGLSRRRQENNVGAEADLTVAIERGGAIMAVYSERAGARLVLGNYAGSESDSTAAIERGRDDAAIYVGRGVARRQQADYAGAESDFSDAIDRKQQGTNVFVWRGELRRRRGDLTGAEADFTEAIDRGADDATVYSNRGHVRLMQGNNADAEADLTAAIDRGTNDALVYGYRGALRLMLEDYAGAEADLSAAIARGQNDPQCYFFRGSAHHNQHSFSKAEADYSAAIERGQDDSDVYRQRALTRVYLDRLDDARRDCESAAQRGKDEPNTHTVWGWWRLGRREYEAALSRFQAGRGAIAGMGWQFQEGLAQLLAGRLEDAQIAYSAGLQETEPSVLTEALWDLDFWTRQQADRVTSDQAQLVVATIRRLLESGQASKRTTV